MLSSKLSCVSAKHPVARHYKYLLLLATIFIVAGVITPIVDNKIILVCGFPVSGGAFVFPISFALADVITEVYGYQISRQMIWLLIFGQILCGVFIFTLIKLPAAHVVAQRDIYFNHALQPVMRIVAGGTVIIWFSTFCNIYLLSKWKILLRGRYFLMRCILSSAVGDAICTIMAVFWMYGSDVPLSKLFILMATGYLMKIAYVVVLAFPALAAVVFLKKREGVDAYDNNIKFNPFVFDVGSS
ncbi:MAG: queuosine precursor transporter [Gammaproteobacteria bacterium]|nr:queuosine precursor transporter [Gammaproteobacteria bacterium]